MSCDEVSRRSFLAVVAGMAGSAPFLRADAVARGEVPLITKRVEKLYTIPARASTDG